MQRKLVPARAHAREATALRWIPLGMDCTQAATGWTERLEVNQTKLRPTRACTKETNVLCSLDIGCPKNEPKGSLYISSTEDSK